MKTKILISLSFALVLLVLTLNMISALSVDSEYITIYPGDSGSVTLNVKNNLNNDLTDVSVMLVLNNLPFTTVGSSEKIKDINEGDSEKFTFTIKASTDAVPGDYSIPYKITYLDSNGNNVVENGTFGLRISAKTELDFSAEARGATINTAVVGQQGKVSLNIINKGLGKIKFVSVQIFPNGFDLTSGDDKVYIGTIASDDSDTATFDVIFKSQTPVLSATVSYKDFDNKDQTQTINLPVKVYTQDQALQLGLVQKSRTTLYIGIVVGLVVIWFVWRSIRKRRKNKNRIGGN
jgi:hypothetical protein